MRAENRGYDERPLGRKDPRLDAEMNVPANAEDAALVAQLNVLAAVEAAVGFELFLGRPVRWHDDPHWRCASRHVRTHYLGSEAEGNVRCMASGCGRKAYLTFPEDIEGVGIGLG